MTGRALRRKAAPPSGWRAQRRPAFHAPANDNWPVVNWRPVAWAVTALGGIAAIAVVIGVGF